MGTYYNPRATFVNTSMEFIRFVKGWRLDQSQKNKPCGLMDFKAWWNNPAEYEKTYETSVASWVGFKESPHA